MNVSKSLNKVRIWRCIGMRVPAHAALRAHARLSLLSVLSFLLYVCASASAERLKIPSAPLPSAFLGVTYPCGGIESAVSVALTADPAATALLLQVVVYSPPQGYPSPSTVQVQFGPQPYSDVITLTVQPR